jgi:mannose-6-phosphate isomerase-like protein (cupin superfamily)
MSEKLGGDPIDQYSVMLERQEIRGSAGTLLGIQFQRQRRANPDKPGRTLSVGWDAREPMVPGFVNHYLYTMRFRVAPGTDGQPAGRHYHHEKNEMFRAIVGDFVVALEVVNGDERAVLDLSSDAGLTASDEEYEDFLYVPAGIAHAVKPLTTGVSALEVSADHPNLVADEFPYHMDI